MSTNTSYVYHVELLIEDENHSAALAQLINKLNDAALVDYKIISGIQLGNDIDARKKNAIFTAPVPVKPDAVKEKISLPLDTSSAPLKAAVQANETALSEGLNVFRQYKMKNTLIRLIINRGLGIKVSIPCRVINIDEQKMIITVYHVDEKQVYTFRLTEIEDFIEG
jgi:hypothetical protein